MPIGQQDAFKTPETYSIRLNEFEPFKTSNPLNININLSLTDIYHLLDHYEQDGKICYNRDDNISQKLREYINGWLTNSIEANSKLSKVPSVPTTPNPSFSYSGPGYMPTLEYQVW